jgi:hypothetical protein
VKKTSGREIKKHTQSFCAFCGRDSWDGGLTWNYALHNWVCDWCMDLTMKIFGGRKKSHFAPKKKPKK